MRLDAQDAKLDALMTKLNIKIPPEGYVPSPDRSCFEYSGAINEVKELIKKQGKAISVLTSQTSDPQQQKQLRQEKKR